MTQQGHLLVIRRKLTGRLRCIAGIEARVREVQQQVGKRPMGMLGSGRDGQLSPNIGLNLAGDAAGPTAQEVRHACPDSPPERINPHRHS
jgi:hypothetical protein